ncbi:MAG: YicC family protein [Candidatus Dadabacteria bacterium]|nr:YicC family protein [Candidatus Dadabacteria bacterium]
MKPSAQQIKRRTRIGQDMRSMTGFGRSEAVAGNVRLTVEARSENHRFFDARISLPEGAGSLERGIRDRLSRAVLRGKVKLTVSCESAGGPEAEIDMGGARAALAGLRKLKKQLNIKGDITIDQILSFGGLVKPPAASRRVAASPVTKTVAAAVAELDDSRRREGKRLQKELRSRISKCAAIVRKIKRERSSYEAEMKRKISALEKEGTDAYKEMALSVERSDITEELVRMDSHIVRFREFVAKTDFSVGRELDFLAQEMNREAGTISAKSKSPAISHLAVDLRSEIEKAREQVQNVE